MSETSIASCGDVITTFLPRRRAQIYAKMMVKDGGIQAASWLKTITGGRLEEQKALIPYLKQEFAKYGWDYKEPTDK